MKSRNTKNQNLFSLSKQDLVSTIVRLQDSLSQLQKELLKSQVMAATRLDVIRLLGFIMNRDPSSIELTKITPIVPEVKRIVCGELNDLSIHLRERADEFDKVSERLLIELESKDDSEKQVKE